MANFVNGGPAVKGRQLVYRGLSGDPGDYTIETSTDLIEWTPLSTVANTEDVAALSDATASDTGQRFYRAVPKP